MRYQRVCGLIAYVGKSATTAISALDDLAAKQETPSPLEIESMILEDLENQDEEAAQQVTC
jgi:hypothetical protein